MKALLIGLFMALISSLSSAQGIDPAIRDQLATLKNVKHLPVKGLSIIETSDGKVFLTSDDGRLVIIGGKWIDLWEGRVITSLEDASTFDHVNLSKMRINLDDLLTFTIGSGPREVVMVMDPKCEACFPPLSTMRQLGSQYTFKVVVIPLLSKESGEASKRLLCAPDRKTALAALMSKSFASLPEPSKGCDSLPLQKSIIIAKMLNVNGLPFFILPNHKTAHGPVTDLAALLSTNKE